MAEETAPPHQCYGCWWYGKRNRLTEGFVDERTGRRFCAECLSALISWELDGKGWAEADDPELAAMYAEWAGAETSSSSHG